MCVFTAEAGGQPWLHSETLSQKQKKQKGKKKKIHVLLSIAL
jgi:hypothetical protein